MKKKNKIYSDCVSTNVTCIKWNLPPIPCLGIQTGDMLDVVLFGILDKVCSAVGTTDLSQIELQCLISKLNITEPSQRTIVTLFQLAYDNDCKLYDLIQQVRNLITNSVPLTLDLKCLATFDSFGNQLPYNEQTVLQSLITNVCLLITNIAGFAQDILNVNIRIDNLPAPYTEPNISSCLSGTPKTTSQTVALLATDYCTFKDKVGNSSLINQAIGAQPTIIDNTDPLFANPDLITPPTSLANSDVNQWVFIESLLNRIKSLEACACKFDCSDIKIAFNVEDQENGEQVALRFSGDYGNFIPSDFDISTDSKITFIDKNKSQKSYTIPVGNINTLNTEWLSPDYDISMLDLSGLITIKVCGKFINTATGQICCKCEETQHMFVGTCSFCEISATAEVTIIFKNSLDLIQSVTLFAGQSYILPSNSKVVSVSNINNLTEVPPCLNLSGLEAVGCFIAVIGSWAENVGSIIDTGYWEGSGNGHQILGIEFEGNNYFTPTSIKAIPGTTSGVFDMNAEVAPKIKALHGIILEANGADNHEASAGDLGISLNYLQIKTVSSYVNKLRLVTRSVADGSISGNREVNAYIKFISYQDAVTKGYVGLPPTLCPVLP